MLERKIIGMAPPERLGILRAIVVFTILLYVSWEKFSAIADLPLSWYDPVGFMMFIPRSIMNPLLVSAKALMIFKAVLIVFLVSAMIGFRTRISLIVSTIMFFLFAGIVRSYAWFFHTGLVPLYLMFFLCFLPCANGFSIDHRFKNRYKTSEISGYASSPVAWSVFLLRTILAFSYFQAGYAKLHNSGWAWTAAWNLKKHVLTDTLSMMQFHFNGGLIVCSLPDSFWTVLATAAVLSELIYPIVLVSWHMRRVYPVVGMMLHGGILFLHNIFFPDLILLQLIFYDWDRYIGILPAPPQDRRRGGFFSFFKLN